MDINKRVAQNLKACREEKHLSLEQLSRLSGVSKSMLGQIERGEVNPTISVLWKIASGLKISLTALVEKSSASTEIIKGNEIIPLEGDNGKYLNYPVFPFDESTQFETYRVEIQPGGYLKALPHLDGAVEYITVFEGNVVIHAGETVCPLSTGDSLRFRADVPHIYSNPGNTLAQLSMLIHYHR